MYTFKYIYIHTYTKHQQTTKTINLFHFKFLQVSPSCHQWQWLRIMIHKKLTLDVPTPPLVSEEGSNVTRGSGDGHEGTGCCNGASYSGENAKRWSDHYQCKRQ